MPRSSFLLIVLACGCSNAVTDLRRDQPAQKAVHVTEREREPGVQVERREPASGCRQIGFVEAKSPSFGSRGYERATRGLQKQAARQGANYVVLDSIHQLDLYAVILRGRSYACPVDA